MSLINHITDLGGYIVPFLFVLTVVVFFHELGHFLVGRWCGVQVDAFSIGFGPELLSRVDGKGTRWRLALIPLGGYVKFHGDSNGASRPDAAALAAMPRGERNVTFFGQQVWKRAAIVVAGPVANFILAVIIFTGTFYIYGRQVLLPRVETVVESSAAARSGFQPGDLIVSIDGQPITSFSDVQRIVEMSGGLRLHVEVRRGESQVGLEATPERRDVAGPFGTNRMGVLGVGASSNPADWHAETYSIPQSSVLAVKETWFVVESTASYIGGLFTGRETTAQLSGPIRIAEASGKVAKLGMGALLNLAALLSISIGFINLVPIPLLDGGHLMYFGIEALRGRPMSERVQEIGFRIGLVLVAALMIFTTFNDVMRLVHG